MGQSQPIRKDAMTNAPLARSGGRCPICKADTAHAYRPFCSSRCADVDLGNWLTGGYAIPVADDAGDSEDDGSDAVASRADAAKRGKTDHEDD